MNAATPASPPTQPPRPPGGFPWLVAGSLLIALGLLAIAIVLTQTQLRAELRNQLANRDAQGLAAIVRKQLATPSDTGDQDPLPALLEALILPELPGIWSVELYDETGRLSVSLLRDPRAHPPTPMQFATVARALNERDSVENPTVLPLAAEFSEQGGPQLNVLLPVETTPSITGQAHRPPTLAAITLDGSGLAGEFVRLDRTLSRRSWLVFGLLGTVMSVALGLAFQRLMRTDRLLRQRTAHLEVANRELTLSAKTSAVGAVTAHLVHGLKNPLAGLQQFVTRLDPGGTAPEQADAADAAATARRMKAMIDDVVRVLRDEQGVTAFELTVAELLAHVRQRSAGVARDLGVQLDCSTDLSLPLSNRTANLTALILENLVTNALQVLTAGGTVSVTARAVDGAVLLQVHDTGPGLPTGIREHLFQPGFSTKIGGTGLGLALSQQLARSLEGELTLSGSDSHGTTFTLRLPAGRSPRTNSV